MWHIWGSSRACGTYEGGVGHVARMGEEYGMWHIWGRSSACGTYGGGDTCILGFGEEM